MSSLTGDMDLRSKACEFCLRITEAATWRDCWLHGRNKICPACGDCPGPFAHGPGFATEPQP